MKKFISWIIALVVFVSAITIVGILYDELKDNTEQEQFADPQNIAADNNEQGSDDSPYTAPDFVVYDAQGRTVSLSDYFGKPIVINFWASWCTYCIQEMPVFNNACHNNPDIQFLMINVTDGNQETFESARNFISGTNFDFTVLYDLDLDAANVYGASALPMTIFIDENGELVTYATGALTADNLERGLAEIR